MQYEFRCHDCGEIFIASHPMGEPHPETHPGCGGTLNRVFVIPGVVYRGGGFYTTDKVLTDKPDPDDF